MTRLPGTRTALALAATSALLLAGTVTASAAGAATAATPVITPAQALTTFNAYFPVNNKANAQHSTPLDDTIETGAVAFEDESYNDIAHSLHLAGEDSFTPAAAKVYVPYQTAYPAVFVAQFRYHPKGGSVDKKSVVYFLFAKGKAGDKWKLASSSLVLAGNPLPVLTVNSDGYLPPLPTLSVGRSQLQTLWVKALRTTSTTGKVPGKPWKSTGLLASFAKYENDVRSPDRHLTYGSLPWAPVCVAATGGGLCFATVGQTDRFQLSPAEVGQGLHYTLSTLGDQIDAGGLPKGDYTALTAYRVRTGLLLVATKGATGLRVIGSETDIVGGTGKPTS